jgi:hypothetical protein
LFTSVKITMDPEERRALIEETIATMNRGFAELGGNNQDRNHTHRNVEVKSLRVEVSEVTRQSLNLEEYLD